jgi:hypothetical protein
MAEEITTNPIPEETTASEASKSPSKRVYSQYRGKDSEEPGTEDDSYILIGNPERLKKQLNQINNDILDKENDEKDLNDKIKAISQRIQGVLDAEEEYKLEKRLTEIQQKRCEVRKKLDQLYDQQDSLEQKLPKAERLKCNNSKTQTDIDELSKESKNISAPSLFLENEPIENTVLYVATFFPELSPQDFERVVSYLLENRTISVIVKSKITTEQGETRIIENSEEKALIQIWKESLYQPEKILCKCYLRSWLLENSSQIIDFYLPDLREKLKKYFQEQQFLYLSEQFKRARLLLFDDSDKVAENAMYLSVDMSIASPSAYGEDWLFRCITDLTSQANQNVNPNESSAEIQYLARIQEKKRRIIVFSRISSLIAQMLDYPQLQSVVNRFLEKLMSVSRFDAVLEIVRRLRSAPKFEQLYWVRQLLDRGNEEIRSEAYSLLYSQLKQSPYRIYDLLEIIKAWLPERDRPREKYSASNERALWILLEYCLETTLALNPKYYGCWPSKYPLFASFPSADDNLETLISWLFHPGLQKINEEIRVIPLISSLLAKWFTILEPEEKWLILARQEKKEPHPEASELFDILLQKIICKTRNSQQKELLESWTNLTDYYLQEGKEDESLGNNQLSKQYNIQRNIVRKIKKKFKVLQKNSSVPE